MLKNIQIILALMRNQIRMTLRIRVALFFSIVMPLLMFFIYTFIFGGGSARAIHNLMGPIVVFTITSNTIYGIGMPFVAMREHGILRPYQMTPVRSVHLLVSRLLTNYFLLLLIISIQFGLAFIIFRVIPTSFSLLFSTVSIGILSICCIGLFIASLVNSTQEATIINQLLFFSIIFISGITTPLHSFPKAVQQAALFLPSTHLNLMIKSLMEHAVFGWIKIVELAIMSLAGICFFCIAIALFRWDRYSKIQPRTRNLAMLSLLPYLIGGLAVNLLS